MFKRLPFFLICLLITKAAFSAPLSVFVSILPQKYFVEQIGGQQVQVSVLVGAGESPATYEPRPQQMVQLNLATVYFRIGTPFEDSWIGNLQQNNPQLPIVDLRQDILQQAGHLHDDDDHQNRLDPHIWLDPRNALIMADTILSTLKQFDPQHASDYQQRHQVLVKSLKQLHQQLEIRLSSLVRKRFLVFHPSWGYFAKAYGLEQIAIEFEGKMPGGRALVSLINKMRQENIQVVFVQPQFGKRQAQQIADAIDGKVIAINPLAENYPENLYKVADIFAEVLR